MLDYDRLDSTAGGTELGSYAFLTNADELTSGATTFAQVSSATALLLNSSGYRGRDYASVLKAVRTGDEITWFPGTSSCWYHFRVTAASDVPSAPSRTLLRITLETEDRCGSAARQSDPNYLDGFRRNVAWFGWDDPPDEPEIGPDGIRIMPYRYAVEGGHTYRLVGWRPTSVVIDVPVGMRLRELGFDWTSLGGTYSTFVDETTGARISLDPHTGEDATFDFPLQDGGLEPLSDAVARAMDLIASIRVVPLP